MYLYNVVLIKKQPEIRIFCKYFLLNIEIIAEINS